MRTRWRWVAAAAGLLLLPVISLVVASLIIDPNDYRREIATAVEKATGRALSLNGPLRVRPSLWPTITIYDVKLTNLPGGSRPDMARAERIEAQLSLPSLLWRQIEFISLTLIGPNILFEQVAGKPNWVFKAPGFPSDPTSSEPSSITMRFRNVHVQNGMVTTRLPARTNVIGVRSLDLHHPQDKGPLEISSMLVYSDYQPFSLKASAQPTGAITDPWTTRLEFAAYSTTAEAMGTIDLGGDYDLRVQASSAQLEKLNALLPDLRLPPLRGVSLTTHLSNGPMRGALPVIGETELRFASADLKDQAAGLKLGAVSLSLPSAGGLAAISGSGNLTGQGFAFSGSVGVPEHPDGPVQVPLDFSAQAQPPTKAQKAAEAVEARFSVKGQLSLDTLSFAGLNAALMLRTPALARLRPVVSQMVPALTSVALDGKMTIPADRQVLTLENVKLGSDQGDLAGNATVGLGSSVVFKGKLRSRTLDLDALLTAVGIDQGQATAHAAEARVFSNDTMPWDRLRGPAIDLAADVEAMGFQRRTWHGVQLSLNLDGGRLRIPRVRVAMPGGSAEGSMTVDASVNPAPISLAIHAPAIPFAWLAHYAGLPGEASGSMRVMADLHASGSSVHQIAASLDGPFAAAMAGGSMSNAALRQLVSTSLEALGIAVPPQGTTAIRCLGLSGSFKNGVASFPTIAVDTSYLKLVGEGQLDLGTETVDFRLYPFAQLSGALVKVPVVVEGPLASASGRLQASGLDKLGFLVNAWFGGDTPTICADAELAR